MSEPSTTPAPAPAPAPAPSKRIYWTVVVVTAAATAGVMALWRNVLQRQEEAREHVYRVVELTENTFDPAEWGKNHPRQYDGWKRTAETTRTRYGGGDSIQKLDADPRLRRIFEGYAFAVDYREARGHAHMLHDQDATERVKQFAQPGACLHCHASVIPAYLEAGKKAGVPDSDRAGQIAKGFEVVCAMPYADARKMVTHPVACIDCHAPDSLNLRVTRPAFLDGIARLADSDADVAHLPSIGKWRGAGRKKPYDPNVEASRQELRSMVCAQCHVEYYFAGAGKKLTYPWSKGVAVESIEAYYDEIGHVDWTHAAAGSRTLKAQHPEFELWSRGLHARSGVSCADCHMPYVREGAIKVSDHRVRSPMSNVAGSCQVCHRFPESELVARTAAIQDRHKDLLGRAENAVVALIDEIALAAKAGATDEKLKSARDLHRKAQWRLDFVASENSNGFHAPQEAARILAEAIDYARRGQVEVLRATGRTVNEPRP